MSLRKQKDYDSIPNTTLKNAVRRQHVSDKIGCYLSGEWIQVQLHQ